MDLILSRIGALCNRTGIRSSTVLEASLPVRQVHCKVLRNFSRSNGDDSCVRLSVLTVLTPHYAENTCALKSWLNVDIIIYKD